MSSISHIKISISKIVMWVIYKSKISFISAVYDFKLCGSKLFEQNSYCTQNRVNMAFLCPTSTHFWIYLLDFFTMYMMVDIKKWVKIIILDFQWKGNSYYSKNVNGSFLDPKSTSVYEIFWLAPNDRDKESFLKWLL